MSLDRCEFLIPNLYRLNSRENVNTQFMDHELRVVFDKCGREHDMDKIGQYLEFNKKLSDENIQRLSYTVHRNMINNCLYRNLDLPNKILNLGTHIWGKLRDIF